jgi:hypothetical protein
MARYFAGNSLASFSRNAVGVIETTTGAGTRFDSAFVPNALLVPSSTNAAVFAEGRLSANASGNVWIHFEHWAAGGGGATTGVWLILLNSAGVPVFRLPCLATNLLQPQVWSGSAWVNTGSTFTTNSALNRWDLRFTPGNGGSFDMYAAGSLVSSGTGHSVTGVTADVRSFRLGTWSSSQDSYFSQILCGDFDTRDSRYRQATINANGALTDGTGGFADIAETVLDETTSIKLSTATNRKSFTKAAITVPGGYRIGAVNVALRGRVAGSLTDAQASLRLSSTNYDSASLGLTAGYEPRQNIWETNPATSGDWTQTDFNAAEIGVEAV